MSVAFTAAPRPESDNSDKLNMDDIVVIYQENHSFDNLYGSLGTRRRAQFCRLVHTQQVNQANLPFHCLKQNDPSFTSPPLPVSCTDSANGHMSAFKNAPFILHSFISPTANDLSEWNAGRNARRLHSRPGPSLLPGTVSTSLRHAEPLCHRQRCDRADHGYVQDQGAADLQVPPFGGASALRHRRQFFPGVVRWFVS